VSGAARDSRLQVAGGRLPGVYDGFLFFADTNQAFQDKIWKHYL